MKHSFWIGFHSETAVVFLLEATLGGAKIEIKVGKVSFAAEGNEKWLSVQLDKVLRQLPDLAGMARRSPDGDRDLRGKFA